jgi:hypothetical protein
MNNTQKSYAIYDNFFIELIISINRSVKENADEIYRPSKCWCKKQVNNIKELLQ